MNILRSDEDDNEGFLHIAMFCFAGLDLILQIVSLVTAGAVQTSMATFQESKCLDVTNIDGLKKHDILTGLAGSVGLSFILGFAEIFLTLCEVMASQCAKMNSKMKDASVGVLLVFDRDDRQKENKYDRDGLV